MSENEIKTYKCIKGFSIDLFECDFILDNEDFTIEEGSIWNTPEDIDYRILGGEVRLENDEDYWIEISNEHLETHFILIAKE